MKNSKFAIGSKTMIAAAIAAMMSGAAMAATYEQPKEDVKVFTVGTTQEALDKATESNLWYAPTTEGTPYFLENGTLAQGKTLYVISTSAGTKATGLYATGFDKITTNNGTIKVQAQSEANGWSQKGMMADAGATAVNNGTIEADNGYGMTVGSTMGHAEGKVVGSTIINAGTITVKTLGAGMELGAAHDATAINKGTIKVEAPSNNDSFAIGTLIKGSEGTFTNEGTIEAADGAFAISIEGKEANKDTQVDTDATIVLANGSKTIGNVQVKGEGGNAKPVEALFQIEKGAQVEGDFLLSTGNVGFESDGATIQGNINVSGGVAELDGDLAVEGVKVSAGEFTIAEGSLSFVPAKTKAATPDILVTGGEFNIAEKGSVSAEDAQITAGTVNLEGDLTVTNLSINAAGTAPVQVAGSLDVTNLTVTDTSSTGGSAIRLNEGSVASLSGKLETATGTYAFNITTDSTLTLGEDVDVSKATAGALNLQGGTLETSTAFFRDADGKIVGNTVVGSYNADNTQSTISLTDSKISVEDLQAINTALASVTSTDLGLEIQADTVTQNDKVITSLQLKDWDKTFGSGTAANIAALTTSNGFSTDFTGPQFGAKQLVLTDATEPTADVKLNVAAGKTMTLVGDAAGSNLIAWQEGYDKATSLEVAGTVNFGLATGTASTKGVLDGGVSVLQNGAFNVRNGSFSLNDTLSNAGTATIAKSGELTVGDVTVNKVTTSSIVNSGTLNVAGTLNAATIENTGTITVTGLLSGKNFKTAAGTAAGTSTVNKGGVLVLAGEASTDPKVTAVGFNVGSVKLESVQTAGTTTPDPKDDVYQGGLLVLGNHALASAQAYQLANAADNILWIGQESNIAGTVAFGTTNTASENVIAIDFEGLAQTGYVADEKLADTKQVVTYGDKTLNGNIVFANLTSINKNMLVYNEDAKAYQLKIGDVTGAVDFGTRFYTGSAENDVVTFNVNETELADLADYGFHSYGAMSESLHNFNFNNQIANTIIFGFDQMEADYNKALFESAKAAGILTEDATFEDAIDGHGFTGRGIAEGREDDAVRLENSLDEAFWNKVIADENTATNLAVLGGAFSTAVDINNEVWKALDRRTSLANLNVARNETGVTPWVDVIGTFNSADGLYGSSGYEADIYGAVFGADWTASCGAILGAAISVGQADANSVDNSTKVDNDVDFWGVSIYGSHQIGNVNGKFDLGYISTSNDLSAYAGYFGKVKESLDADIFTIGLGAEYLANVGSLNVVPHAGFRWSSLDMDDSKYGADYDKMNLFQMPIGVTFSGTFDMTGWKVAPMFDISVVPAFGDKDAVASYTGGIEDSVRVVDTNPIQATLGVNASVGAWTFGVNYGLTAGSDERLNNSLNANARYTF